MESGCPSRWYTATTNDGDSYDRKQEIGFYPVQPEACRRAKPSDSDSFNMAVAQAYCETVRGLGHQAVLRDLYRMGFDPVFKPSERPTDPDFALSPDVAAERR